MFYKDNILFIINTIKIWKRRKYKSMNKKNYEKNFKNKKEEEAKDNNSEASSKELENQ